MSDIVYILGSNLYINLTNRCPCNCGFCLRNSGDAVGSADSLWLEREPSAKEVLSELNSYNFKDFREIVFCGYGEPFCALDALIEISRDLKKRGSIIIRANTNGLGSLINNKATPPLLEGVLDKVSISLNAPNAKSYNAMCRPEFGEGSYEAMLKFAQGCKLYVPFVQFTVVDVIGRDATDACRAIAERMGISFRVRSFE
ncbi:MAG: TIGR04100 family radical SAM protein [Clostridiales bacterium]|jgi:radical SAM enzyme (TIGR04100 family)|nr:TIGR04100 family radical SAM protein [Clostridiales bacterium]